MCAPGHKLTREAELQQVGPLGGLEDPLGTATEKKSSGGQVGAQDFLSTLQRVWEEESPGGDSQHVCACMHTFMLSQFTYV